jgi:AraC-like DNA-binding protein
LEGENKNSKTLPKELCEKIQLDLENAMAKEKMYLRHDLTMHQLAKDINTNTSYLSRIIQGTYSMNFPAFLNIKRINEAKSILENGENDNQTINAISKKCGYKNKSTFNKAFKNIVGLTPKAYREQASVKSDNHTSRH